MTVPLDGSDFPSDFTIANLESDKQRMVREGFESIEVLNRATLLDFDPNQPGSRADIELEISFPEAEDAEPQLTETRRSGMLRNLGLAFEFLDENDPANLFQYMYDDGAVAQIRLVERPDGVKVPVLTSLTEDDEGNTVEGVELLSYDVIAEFMEELEASRVEYRVDERLREEFGLDEEFLRLTDLSLEDKQSMLAAHGEAQGLEVIKPDQELSKVRQKLVKAMLPGSQFMSTIRAGKLPKAIQEYEQSLAQFVKRYDLDEGAAQELIGSEHLQRLSALNKQLRHRRRAVMVGLTATAGSATAAAATLGAMIGTYKYNILSSSAIEETLVGGGLGLALSLEQVSKYRKNSRRVQGFSATGGAMMVDNNFQDQLQREAKLAHLYSSLLRPL